MKSHGIRIYQTGGTDVLLWEAIQLPDCGPDEVRVRHSAVGLNFIDVYRRNGLYPVELPSGLGTEAAGVVEAVGSAVEAFKPGDRVAYCTGPLGAYAEVHQIPADCLVKIPDAITEEAAAASLLKGLTACYLLTRTYPVSSGQTILVQAAAGGVGSILTQWAKHLGAHVIGTVGDEAKVVAAQANGCDHVILYRQEDIAERVMTITNGAGVPVVYDSVGADTFEASLKSLAPLGMLVSFGNASGPVAAINPAKLAAQGSVFFTRPTLFDYARQTEDLQAMAAQFFELLSSGAIKVNVNQRYALKGVAQAHQDLEQRRTCGSSVLLPR